MHPMQCDAMLSSICVAFIGHLGSRKIFILTCALPLLIDGDNIIVTSISSFLTMTKKMMKWFGSSSCMLLLILFSSSINGYQHYAAAFSQQASAEHSSGRRWKNRRKRQTFLPSPSRQITPEEEEALLDQLGYVPPNICCVSAKSGSRADIFTDAKTNSAIDTSSRGIGRPIAIKSYPLLVQILNKEQEQEKYNHTPFPTLYWLTCPHVSRAISEIERNGYVKKFQLRLEDDTSLAKEWWQCHEEYALERWQLLSESDREWLQSNNQVDENNKRKVDSMREMIQYSGVAGTDHRRLRDTDEDKTNKDNDPSLYVPSVKCLHSHYAHYRSQQESDSSVMVNVVGKWTHELLIEEFPDLII